MVCRSGRLSMRLSALSDLHTTQPAACCFATGDANLPWHLWQVGSNPCGSQRCDACTRHIELASADAPGGSLPSTQNGACVYGKLGVIYKHKCTALHFGKRQTADSQHHFFTDAKKQMIRHLGFTAHWPHQYRFTPCARSQPFAWISLHHAQAQNGHHSALLRVQPTRKQKRPNQNSGILLNALPYVSSREGSSASDAGSSSMGGVRAAPLPTCAIAHHAQHLLVLTRRGRALAWQCSCGTQQLTRPYMPMQGCHHVMKVTICGMHPHAYRVQPHPTIAVVSHSALAADLGASRVDHDLDGLLRVHLTTV